MATSKPQLRTEDGTSLDLDNPAAVEAAAGRPALLCTRLRPEWSGRVVHSLTGEGIAGAQLIVESWRASPPLVGRHWVLLDRVRARVFTTETDGAFEIRAEADWLPGILTADGFPTIVQRTCITALGYEAFVYEASPDGEEAGLPERIAMRPMAGSADPQPVPCSSPR